MPRAAFDLDAGPTVFKRLALQGISGSGKDRLAIINGCTLAAGQMDEIKVGDKRINVCCKEIRKNSAVVTVSGYPQTKQLLLSPTP
jgi:hypothetical protein